MIQSQDKKLLHEFLEEKYHLYARKSFINDDPVQIPHKFQNFYDIEISGLFAATLAWGNRKAIVRSLTDLMNRMDNSPYDFVTNFTKSDEKYLDGFVHRTFNKADCVGFIKVIKDIYLNSKGLKSIFVDGYQKDNTVKSAISGYRATFLNREIDKGILVHVPNVESGSAAKRINMFLRWMVRPAKEGVDFGLWNEIPTSALMIPLDVHSGRVARAIGLLQRNQSDWRSVEELTHSLCVFDKDDPIKYDFALFGLGVYEKF